MLRDIVVDLATEAGDVEVADEVAAAQALDALESSRADFVIGGRLDDRLVAELLRVGRDVRVLTVSDDGHGGTLHRLAVQTTWLGELSPDRLLVLARSRPDPPRR